MSSIHQVVELTQKEFDKLPEYSKSIPTGVVVGKRWKRRCTDCWLMGEYVATTTGYVVMQWKEIKIEEPSHD